MASENIRTHLRHAVVTEGGTNHVLCGSTVHSFSSSTVPSIFVRLLGAGKATLAITVSADFAAHPCFILNEGVLDAF